MAQTQQIDMPSRTFGRRSEFDPYVQGEVEYAAASTGGSTLFITARVQLKVLAGHNYICAFGISYY